MCLAIPGRVEEITDDGLVKMGRINFGGVIKRVCLDYVPEITVGDYAIVHVGFAISVIDEESAQKTLEVFRQMGVLEEELASEEEAFARAAQRPQSNCPDGSCSLETNAGPSTAVANATSAQDDSGIGSATRAQDDSKVGDATPAQVAANAKVQA